MARHKGAVILFAMLALASQYAFAQLPLETRDLRLQGANSGQFVRLNAGTVATNYSLTFPNAVGTGSGSFLFLGSSDGQFKWSSSVSTTGHIPVWDQTQATIIWVGADSPLFPVWSLSGNQLDAADKKLGSTNNQPFNIVTNNQARVTFAADGAISINTTATGGVTTTIGRTTDSHITAINGTTNIQGTTTINADNSTAVTNIGTGTTTGQVNIGATGNATAQTIAIGTEAGDKILGLGSASGASSTTIRSGTGNVTINSGAGVVNINESVNSATNINTGTSTGAVSIGNAAATNVTVLAANASINNNGGTGSTNIGTGSTTGAVTIGGDAAQAIAIGADATAAKTVSLGGANAGSNTTILGGGSVNINNSASGTTSIGTGATSGQITLGGEGAQTIAIGAGGTGANAKTVNIGSATGASATTIIAGTGNLNINTTGSSRTNIGNSGASGSDTRFSGEIQMEEDPGDAGDVLISSGVSNTPQWKNLNDAIGIRAAGNVTVNNDVVTATISAPGMIATDAILITLQTGSTTSAVTATVTSRNDGAGTFTVTFSAQYTGVVNYLVIKTL